MVTTTGMSDEQILEVLQGVRQPRERRATAAHEMVRATRFSNNPQLKDEVFMAKQLMSIPELYEPLRLGTTDPDELERAERGYASRVGRARMSGDIAPVLLAYMIGTKPEMQHFHGTRLSSAVWELAGWERTPSYGTFWSRLVEGEANHVSAWEEATRFCWTTVRRHVPEACLNWRIDGTAYQAPVMAHHHCLDDEACAKAGGAGMPKRVKRAGEEEIHADRHARQQAAPEGESEPLALGNELTRESLLADLGERIKGLSADFEEEALAGAYPEPVLPKYRRKRLPGTPGEKLFKEIFIGNGPKEDPGTYRHRYVVRDPDAGFRIYRGADGKKFRQWLGGFAITISDDTTGGQIAQFHIPADENEHTAFLDILAIGVRMTGRLPQNVIADCGYNTRRIRQLCTLLGIGLISPFRPPNGAIKDRSQMRKDTHDEYGVPNCHYCGGSGTTVGKDLGFEIRKGRAVVRYRCAAPVTEACYRRLQRRRCDSEWLLLGVISREDPLYFELRHQGRPSESAHTNTRTRSGQAGKEVSSRAKRIGIPFMAYRATIGAFLDVFRLCIWHGWLGSHPKPQLVKLRRRSGGEAAVAILQKARLKAGALLPRGKAAEKLGLLFLGVVPDGYTTIAQRKAEKKAAAKKAAQKKAAKEKAEKAEAAAAAKAKKAAKAKPPPDVAAA